jgi:hypothetical protein
MENLFEADIIDTEPLMIRCSLGDLQVASLDDLRTDHTMLLIRPEAAEVVEPYDDEVGLNVLEGRLVDVSFRGRHQVAVLETLTGNDRSILKFNFESTVTLPPVQSAVRLYLDPDQLRLLAT